MEIILKKDVTDLGYAHDVVTVKNGFARNFLIPQGHAVMATESNKKINAEDLRQKSFKAQKTRKEAELVAKSLENITIDRKKIHVDGESIKETGSYTASIRLHKELVVTINFEVIAE
jgi:large subunit ribosomal protein L9